MQELKLATEYDIPEIVAIAKAQNDEYFKQYVTWSESDVEHLCRKLVQADPVDAVIILTRNDENVCTGVAALFKSILPFSGEVVASELAWWVHPDYRMTKTVFELYNATEYWATNVAKADILQFGVPTTNDKMTKFFSKKGFVKYEELWRKSCR